MRVHIQNDLADPLYAITQGAWQEEAAASGEPAHAVSIADTQEGFAAARGEVELLVGPPAALRRLFPLAAPRLRLVYVVSAGVDGLAPFDWLPEGVLLVNNSGAHGPKAGAYVAMAAVMLATDMPTLLAAQREGRWQPIHTPGLTGRQALVIGTGDLGSAAGQQLRALGMHVTGVNTTGRANPAFDAVRPVAELDTVLPATRLLALACPLTPATRHLIDARRLGLLRLGAGVVNIGRGQVLDQPALIAALEARRLGGAMLDVTDPEPLPPEHPLWRTRGVIVTPHISCDDPETYGACSLAILFANLRAWRAGERPPNLVDVRRGY